MDGRDVPFDAFDGEELQRADGDGDGSTAPEEEAVHEEDDDREPPAPWSALTHHEDDDEDVERTDVRYFPDEQPESGRPHERVADERVPDLEELLEHQHYSFPEEHRDH